MPNHVTNELSASPKVLDSLKGKGLDSKDEPEDLEVDFNTVIPMPEILGGDSSEPAIVDWAKMALGIINPINLIRKALDKGSPLGRGPEIAAEFRKGNFAEVADELAVRNCITALSLSDKTGPMTWEPKRFDRLLRYMKAIREHGYASWYEWSVENWGTKWNAYDFNRIDDSTVRFQTAWAAPLPVISSLSLKFPEEEIKFQWADEDFGANVGSMVFRAGEIISGGPLKDCSRESRALACRLIYNDELPDYYRRTANGDIELIEEEG